jgi:CheY-like chemotaxis protein
MRKKGRVLVVEDDMPWLEMFEELLRELGLEVVATNNYASAIELLDREYFHLVVADVRLVDEDKDNTEGLDILSFIDEIGLGDVVTKIVVTGYGTRDWARQSFKEHKVHDFIPKQGADSRGFDEADFVQSVKSALDDRVDTDRHLEIEFIHGLSWEEMASKIAPSCGYQEHSEMLEWELEDLLKKLFPNASRLIVSRVSGGHSQSGIVQVEPFYRAMGQAMSVIVKYGPVSEMEKEAENYEKYIKPFTAGQRHTDLECMARTRSLGGVVYSLVEKVRSFNDFYLRSSPADVCLVLDDFFSHTCEKWYADRRPRRTESFVKLYWEPAYTTYEELLACFEHMYSRFVDKPQISFPDVDNVFINPLYHRFTKDEPIYLKVHMATTHGDLHGDNLLIDKDNHTWMIDFSRAGEGHIFRDFVALESTIKFQLLEEESMDALYAFEKAIQSPTRFSDSPDRPRIHMSDEMHKSFETLECLRRMAGRVIQPSEDMRDYYAGLFYYTLNLIRYYHLLQRKRRKYYILLSAAMLCEKLDSWEDW